MIQKNQNIENFKKNSYPYNKKTMVDEGSIIPLENIVTNLSSTQTDEEIPVLEVVKLQSGQKKFRKNLSKLSFPVTSKEINYINSLSTSETFLPVSDDISMKDVFKETRFKRIRDYLIMSEAFEKIVEKLYNKINSDDFDLHNESHRKFYFYMLNNDMQDVNLDSKNKNKLASSLRLLVNRYIQPRETDPKKIKKMTGEDKEKEELSIAKKKNAFVDKVNELYNNSLVCNPETEDERTLFDDINNTILDLNYLAKKERKQPIKEQLEKTIEVFRNYRSHKVDISTHSSLSILKDHFIDYQVRETTNLAFLQPTKENELRYSYEKESEEKKVCYSYEKRFEKIKVHLQGKVSYTEEELDELKTIEKHFSDENKYLHTKSQNAIKLQGELFDLQEKVRDIEVGNIDKHRDEIVAEYQNRISTLQGKVNVAVNFQQDLTQIRNFLSKRIEDNDKQHYETILQKQSNLSNIA